MATDGDGGPHIMRALAGAVARRGIVAHCDTAATALVADSAGRIVGVRVRRFDGVADIQAHGGVVLAGGGFAMNRAMVGAYAPRIADPVVPVGSTYDDGTAIHLGHAAGGALRHMDGVFVSVTNYPPATLIKGELINARGCRVVAEDSYHGRTGTRCLDQPDGRAFLLVDLATFAHPEFGSMPFIDGRDTLAEAGHHLDLPAGSLQATVAAYNEHAARGEDPQFHKHADWLQPTARGTTAASASARPRTSAGAPAAGARRRPAHSGSGSQSGSVGTPAVFATIDNIV